MTAMFAKQLGTAGEVAGHPAPAGAPTPAGHPAPAVAALSAGPAPAALDPAAPSGVPQFLVPVAGRPSSGYGLRADPIHGGTVNHPGFDLAATAGTEVAAAARGTVVHAGPAGTYGNLVTVRHENGFETRYAHLSEVDVKVGDQVEAGAELGKVGTTGYSTGPHLHFEVRHDGHPIDPAPLLPLNRSASRTTR
jgi:murein DD-endopeptidase MepM/ murein hydrolase activator NlpD